MLAGAMGKFHMLKYGLAAVLVFVGLKMVWLNQAFGGKFPISWSLGIIAFLIVAAVAASFLFPRRSGVSELGGAGDEVEVDLAGDAGVPVAGQPGVAYHPAKNRPDHQGGGPGREAALPGKREV